VVLGGGGVFSRQKVNNPVTPACLCGARRQA